MVGNTSRMGTWAVKSLGISFVFWFHFALEFDFGRDVLDVGLGEFYVRWAFPVRLLLSRALSRCIWECSAWIGAFILVPSV